MNTVTSGLSVIIPTIGRKSLNTVLRQLICQITDSDEIIVSADGTRPTAYEVVKNINDLRIVYTQTQASKPGDIGYSARNNAMKIAKKSHLYFLDDDDEIQPDALSRIRSAIATHPQKILIFRINHSILGVIWKKKEMELGNVSTQMFVVPNVSQSLGKWEPMTIECGDFKFLKNCLEKYPSEIEWKEDVIATQGMAEDRKRQIGKR